MSTAPRSFQNARLGLWGRPRGVREQFGPQLCHNRVDQIVYMFQIADRLGRFPAIRKRQSIPLRRQVGKPGRQRRIAIVAHRLDSDPVFFQRRHKRTMQLGPKARQRGWHRRQRQTQWLHGFWPGLFRCLCSTKPRRPQRQTKPGPSPSPSPSPSRSGKPNCCVHLTQANGQRTRLSSRESGCVLLPAERGSRSTNLARFEPFSNVCPCVIRWKGCFFGGPMRSVEVGKTQGVPKQPKQPLLPS